MFTLQLFLAHEHYGAPAPCPLEELTHLFLGTRGAYAHELLAQKQEPVARRMRPVHGLLEALAAPGDDQLRLVRSHVSAEEHAQQCCKDSDSVFHGRSLSQLRRVCFNRNVGCAACNPPAKARAHRRNMTRALLVALLAFAAAPLAAQDVSKPMILVAKPELSDPIYAHTVLVVAPLGGDQHVGFIVNRPSELTLSKVFPGDGPSQKISDPIYLGGPLEPELVFALVERKTSPGGKSLAVLPGLYAAVEAQTVDGIIRDHARGARFVSGLVAWQAGELAGEVQAGAWYVLAPDTAVLHEAPEHLWQELVRRSQNAANAI